MITRVAKIPRECINKSIAILTISCFVFSFTLSQPIQAVIQQKHDLDSFKSIFNTFILPSGIGRITEARYYEYPSTSREIIGNVANQPLLTAPENSTDIADTLVINIQDLHCHPEAQKNIFTILSILHERFGLEKVFVEGAIEDVDTSWLAALQNGKLKQEIADKLLNQGKLTGAEYFSVTTLNPHLLYGLENEKVYKENLVRLGLILKNNAGVTSTYREMQNSIASLKQIYFGPKNKKLDRLISDRKDAKIDDNQYYEKLSAYATGFGIAVEKYENFAKYKDLLERSKGLKYKKISAELQDFLGVLKEKLPPHAYKLLVQKTDNFSKPDFLYTYLSIIADEYKLDLSVRYPNLKSFFEYTKRNQGINPIKMFNEEKNIINDIQLKFSSTTGEREVVFIANFLNNFKDYLDGRVSAEDYEFVARNIDEFKSLWAKYDDINLFEQLEPELAMYRKYYTANEERNTYFLNNCSLPQQHPHEVDITPAQMKTRADLEESATPELAVMPFDGDHTAKILESLPDTKNIIVMVTGGFHTPGITKLLRKQSIPYLIITPNITQETQTAEQTYEELINTQSELFSQYIEFAEEDKVSSAETETTEPIKPHTFYFNETLLAPYASAHNIRAGVAPMRSSLGAFIESEYLPAVLGLDKNDAKTRDLRAQLQAELKTLITQQQDLDAFIKHLADLGITFDLKSWKETSAKGVYEFSVTNQDASYTYEYNPKNKTTPIRKIALDGTAASEQQKAQPFVSLGEKELRSFKNTVLHLDKNGQLKKIASILKNTPVGPLFQELLQQLKENRANISIEDFVKEHGLSIYYILLAFQAMSQITGAEQFSTFDGIDSFNDHFLLPPGKVVFRNVAVSGKDFKSGNNAQNFAYATEYFDEDFRVRKGVVYFTLRTDYLNQLMQSKKNSVQPLTEYGELFVKDAIPFEAIDKIYMHPDDYNEYVAENGTKAKLVKLNPAKTLYEQTSIAQQMPAAEEIGEIATQSFLERLADNLSSMPQGIDEQPDQSRYTLSSVLSSLNFEYTIRSGKYSNIIGILKQLNPTEISYFLNSLYHATKQPYVFNFFLRRFLFQASTLDLAKEIYFGLSEECRAGLGTYLSQFLDNTKVVEFLSAINRTTTAKNKTEKTPQGAVFSLTAIKYTIQHILAMPVFESLVLTGVNIVVSFIDPTGLSSLAVTVATAFLFAATHADVRARVKQIQKENGWTGKGVSFIASWVRVMFYPEFYQRFGMGLVFIEILKGFPAASPFWYGFIAIAIIHSLWNVTATLGKKYDIPVLRDMYLLSVFDTISRALNKRKAPSLAGISERNRGIVLAIMPEFFNLDLSKTELDLDEILTHNLDFLSPSERQHFIPLLYKTLDYYVKNISDLKFDLTTNYAKEFMRYFWLKLKKPYKDSGDLAKFIEDVGGIVTGVDIQKELLEWWNASVLFEEADDESTRGWNSIIAINQVTLIKALVSRKIDLQRRSAEDIQAAREVWNVRQAIIRIGDDDPDNMIVERIIPTLLRRGATHDQVNDLIKYTFDVSDPKERKMMAQTFSNVAEFLITQGVNDTDTIQNFTTLLWRKVKMSFPSKDAFYQACPDGIGFDVIQKEYFQWGVMNEIWSDELVSLEDNAWYTLFPLDKRNDMKIALQEALRKGKYSGFTRDDQAFFIAKVTSLMQELGDGYLSQAGTIDAIARKTLEYKALNGWHIQGAHLTDAQRVALHKALISAIQKAGIKQKPNADDLKYYAALVYNSFLVSGLDSLNKQATIDGIARQIQQYVSLLAKARAQLKASHEEQKQAKQTAGYASQFNAWFFIDPQRTDKEKFTIHEALLASITKAGIPGKPPYNDLKRYVAFVQSAYAAQGIGSLKKPETINTIAKQIQAYLSGMDTKSEDTAAAERDALTLDALVRKALLDQFKREQIDKVRIMPSGKEVHYYDIKWSLHELDDFEKERLVNTNVQKALSGEIATQDQSPTQSKTDPKSSVSPKSKTDTNTDTSFLRHFYLASAILIDTMALIAAYSNIAEGNYNETLFSFIPAIAISLPIILYYLWRLSQKLMVFLKTNPTLLPIYERLWIKLNPQYFVLGTTVLDVLKLIKKAAKTLQDNPEKGRLANEMIFHAFSSAKDIDEELLIGLTDTYGSANVAVALWDEDMATSLQEYKQVPKCTIPMVSHTGEILYLPLYVREITSSQGKVVVCIIGDSTHSEILSRIAKHSPASIAMAIHNVFERIITDAEIVQSQMRSKGIDTLSNGTAANLLPAKDFNPAAIVLHGSAMAQATRKDGRITSMSRYPGLLNNTAYVYLSEGDEISGMENIDAIATRQTLATALGAAIEVKSGESVTRSNERIYKTEEKVSFKTLEEELAYTERAGFSGMVISVLDKKNPSILNQELAKDMDSSQTISEELYSGMKKTTNPRHQWFLKALEAVAKTKKMTGVISPANADSFKPLIKKELAKYMAAEQRMKNLLESARMLGKDVFAEIAFDGTVDFNTLNAAIDYISGSSFAIPDTSKAPEERTGVAINGFKGLSIDLSGMAALDDETKQKVAALLLKARKLSEKSGFQIRIKVDSLETDLAQECIAANMPMVFSYSISSTLPTNLPANTIIEIASPGNTEEVTDFHDVQKIMDDLKYAPGAIIPYWLTFDGVEFKDAYPTWLGERNHINATRMKEILKTIGLAFEGTAKEIFLSAQKTALELGNDFVPGQSFYQKLEGMLTRRFGDEEQTADTINAMVPERANELDEFFRLVLLDRTAASDDPNYLDMLGVFSDLHDNHFTAWQLLEKHAREGLATNDFKAKQKHAVHISGRMYGITRRILVKAFTDTEGDKSKFANPMLFADLLKAYIQAATKQEPVNEFNMTPTLEALAAKSLTPETLASLRQNTAAIPAIAEILQKDNALQALEGIILLMAFDDRIDEKVGKVEDIKRNIKVEFGRISGIKTAA